MDDDTLVKVAAYATAIEAHLARTKLESEGIEAFILDENIIAINWLYSAAIGGAKIHVRRADAERAYRILENIPDDFSLPTQVSPTREKPEIKGRFAKLLARWRAKLKK